MDVLINNAIIYDPEESKSFFGGVAIIGSRIAEVYSEHSVIPVDKFDRVIDAKTKYLFPGFIDVHSRGDLAMVSENSRISAISQGIALEVIGQDGFSVAPISSKNYMLHGEYVFSSLGNPQLRWRWESVFEYLDMIHGKNGTNVLFYAPHGTMRLEASLNTKLSPTGISALKYSLEKAMDDGAIGMSVSVWQSPSKDGWEDNAEMETLLSVLKKKNGILCVNLENPKNIRKDIDRAFGFAKSYGLKLHLSGLLIHDASEYMEIIASLDRKKKEIPGLLLDISPYNSRLIKLLELLPEDYRSLSPEEIRIKLKNPEAIQEVFNHLNIHEQYLRKIRLVATSKKDLKKHENHLLEDVAKEKGESIHNIILSLLMFDIENSVFEYEAVSPSVLKYAFENEFVLPATSGCMEGRYTPDIFGAITRYISHYSEKDSSKIAEKLSVYPAKFYGLKWGIKQGLKANLALVDVDSTFSEGDFVNPRVIADGTEYVVVNGKIIWEKGKVTGSRNGEVITWS